MKSEIEEKIKKLNLDKIRGGGGRVGWYYYTIEIAQMTKFNFNGGNRKWLGDIIKQAFWRISVKIL